MITYLINHILTFLGFMTPAIPYIPTTYITQASYRVVTEPNDTLKNKADLYIRHLERSRRRKGYSMQLSYSFQIIKDKIVIQLFSPEKEYLAGIQKWIGGAIQNNQVVYSLAL